MITEQQEQEFKNINKEPCLSCGLYYCDCVKCGTCKELREPSQMKDNKICNICAYEINSKKDYKKTKEKFKGAVKI